MIEKVIKNVFIAGTIIVLLSGIAVATVREDVRNTAMHAFDKDSVNGNRVNPNNYGNWNWLSTTPSIYGAMKDGYTIKNPQTGIVTNCFASLWSTTVDGSGCSPFTGVRPPSFYNDVGTYGSYEGKGRGMQCKAFANGILYAVGQTVETLNQQGNPVKQSIFHGWDKMLLTVTDNGQTEDRIDKIKHVKIGDVILDKTARTEKWEIIDGVNTFIRYVYYPYTVTAITAGSSESGTVTGVQAKDISGISVTISGTDLEKYGITKYMRGIQFAQSGDVIFKTRHIAESYDHAAIVVKTTGSYGSVVSVDVVDSNYVGNINPGDNNEIIGYHTITGAELDKYYIYTGVSYYNEIWSPSVPVVPPTPPTTNAVLYRYDAADPSNPENDRVYEIRQDTSGRKYKHWIIDPKVFQDSGYDASKIIDDYNGWNLEQYILGENIGFKDGTLIIRPDGRIYQIKDKQKHWFPTWDSFASKGYTLAMTYPVSDTIANLVPSGTAIDYRLVQVSGKPEVYLTEGTSKRHIKSPETMTIWGFSWSQIQPISQASLDAYAYAGELIANRYGTFIGKKNEGIKVYFVSADSNGNPIKRWIPHQITLSYLGGTSNSVIWLSDEEFNLIPEGITYDQQPILTAIVPSDPNDCQSCHIEPMPTSTATPTPTPTPTNPLPQPAPTVTPTPTPNPLAMFDLNNDRAIGIADLIIITSHFGEITSAPYPTYDINQDGKVDVIDLVLVAKHFRLTY